LFTLQSSILIVAYVVFGGMGSLYGAMAGAAVLTWLPQFLKAQVPSDDRPMWVGAAILAMMIFRPAGLLPAKRRKAELEHDALLHDEKTPQVAGLIAIDTWRGGMG
jgi:ABC-type branched-subunit amino acid transport system permease subunit